MGKPRHFDECFTTRIKSGRNFATYAAILRTGAAAPSESRPEKHHIVPREWLSMNADGFRFDAEDPSNVTYLSVRNKILAMVQLAVIFLETGDSRTYAKLTETISRRYHLGRYEYWKNPFMDRETVSFLAEKRMQELCSRKRKYSDDYLGKCHEIYMNSGKSFEAVVRETGFPCSERSLLRNFRERGLAT